MPATSTLPVPRPTAITKPFWEACNRGELDVQRCAECGNHVFIPGLMCPRCQGTSLEWVRSSGRGTVYSFTAVYRPQQPAFEVPYVVAIVELEEGWFLPTNIVGVGPEQVQFGMPVQVEFERRTDDIAVPVFRPV